MKQDFLSLQNFTREQILELLNLTSELKFDSTHSMELLKGKTIGLLFQKPSNRTRVSFEVGISQMNGNCVYLGPDEINMGVRETPSDVSKTLSRYLDGIVARLHTHQDMIDLSKHADIPIINGLTDLFHPCQAMTDLYSIKEKFKELEGHTLAYVGDGNNVCHSLLLGCSKVGLNIKIATPVGYEPKSEIIDAIRITIMGNLMLRRTSIDFI